MVKTNLFALLLLLPLLIFGQSKKYEEKTATENGKTYTYVTNDPLNTRIYTLSNGLKVYLSVYKDAPRIQTYIAVKAGSKNDPQDATGLAHYLEHILFKGTSKIGTSDWAKEKVELEKIEALYEKYRKTKDETQREKLYRQIDSVSLVAATYAVANEYDKMLSNIGAVGTNAYTFVEQTVYVNDIPANQIEKWAEIEAERFGEVVPRLFHTELEAVYEEKNRGLDSDQRKVWEAMLSSIFKKHTYGTQTTIGTVEHLKNPSITEIKKYFNTYYVPNNMAICLSGDMDPEKTIATLEKYFSKLKPKPIPSFDAPKEDPIAKPEKKVIYGPDAENLSIAFRFPGNNSRESLLLEMLSMVLTNGQAGLIDLNLNQKQKVLTAYSYALRFNDYSLFMMGGRPREGQKLEELKTLLLSQIELVKQGKFEDWLLKAVINDYKISHMRQFESNKARADAMVEAFTSGRSWADYISETDKLATITKEELVEFTNKHFNNNYIEIYKRTGADSTIQKVNKPKISPVAVNREKQSEFYNNVMNKPSSLIEPVFVDYAKDIEYLKIKNNIPLLYKQNKENGVFTLNYVLDIGKDHDPKYAIAVDYIDYLGTKKYSAEQLKKEFYKLGCTYGISISNDAVYLNVSGLNENFSAAVKLFESLVANPTPDKEALESMVDGILKGRENSKLNKDAILRSAMVSYAKYGDKSPFKNILAKEELKNLKPEELTDFIKSIFSYQHRVLYYGPENSTKLISKLNTLHNTAATLKEVPVAKKFAFKEIEENQVYFVNYDMVQAEVMFLSKSCNYDKNIVPAIALFNEYFGGGMGSLVFQEMRESKALAYAVRSNYQSASKKEDPNYIASYIGTQADKLTEAVEGLNELIENMPQSESLFANAKNAILENINTQRITKAGVLLDYERAKKLGLDYDIRKDIYTKVKAMSFEDIKGFQQKFMKGQKKVMLVIGSKDKVDTKALEKYGKVKELTLEEIFGY